MGFCPVWRTACGRAIDSRPELASRSSQAHGIRGAHQEEEAELVTGKLRPKSPPHGRTAVRLAGVGIQIREKQDARRTKWCSRPWSCARFVATLFCIATGLGHADTHFSRTSAQVAPEEQKATGNDVTPLIRSKKSGTEQIGST